MSIQESVRNKLIDLIKNEGINQKFISIKTNIAESSLSKFKNATYDLRYSEIERLETYLKSRGY